MSPVADEDLLARQSALQQEARGVLAGLDLAALVTRADYTQTGFRRPPDDRTDRPV